MTAADPTPAQVDALATALLKLTAVHPLPSFRQLATTLLTDHTAALSAALPTEVLVAEVRARGGRVIGVPS